MHPPMRRRLHAPRPAAASRCPGLLLQPGPGQVLHRRLQAHRVRQRGPGGCCARCGRPLQGGRGGTLRGRRSPEPRRPRCAVLPGCLPSTHTGGFATCWRAPAGLGARARQPGQRGGREAAQVRAPAGRWRRRRRRRRLQAGLDRPGHRRQADPGVSVRGAVHLAVLPRYRAWGCMRSRCWYLWGATAARAAQPRRPHAPVPPTSPPLPAASPSSPPWTCWWSWPRCRPRSSRWTRPSRWVGGWVGGCCAAAALLCACLHARPAAHGPVGQPPAHVPCPPARALPRADHQPARERAGARGQAAAGEHDRLHQGGCWARMGRGLDDSWRAGRPPPCSACTSPAPSRPPSCTPRRASWTSWSARSSSASRRCRATRRRWVLPLAGAGRPPGFISHPEPGLDSVPMRVAASLQLLTSARPQTPPAAARRGGGGARGGRGARGSGAGGQRRRGGRRRPRGRAGRAGCRHHLLVLGAPLHCSSDRPARRRHAPAARLDSNVLAAGQCCSSSRCLFRQTLNLPVSVLSLLSVAQHTLAARKVIKVGDAGGPVVAAPAALPPARPLPACPPPEEGCRARSKPSSIVPRLSGKIAAAPAAAGALEARFEQGSRLGRPQARLSSAQPSAAAMQPPGGQYRAPGGGFPPPLPPPSRPAALPAAAPPFQPPPLAGDVQWLPGLSIWLSAGRPALHMVSPGCWRRAKGWVQQGARLCSRPPYFTLHLTATTWTLLPSLARSSGS